MIRRISKPLRGPRSGEISRSIWGNRIRHGALIELGLEAVLVRGYPSGNDRRLVSELPESSRKPEDLTRRAADVQARDDPKDTIGRGGTPSEREPRVGGRLDSAVATGSDASLAAHR